MQRKTIILSSGMLLEKVDISAFVSKLIAKAKEKNPAFKLTPEMQSQGFALSVQFNLGNIDWSNFKNSLLGLYGITMDANEFRDAWNSMIVVGNIGEKIRLLQDAAEEHGALFYLISDTNAIHTLKITDEAEAQHIRVDKSHNIMSTPMMTLGNIPLFNSWQLKKARLDLVEYVVDKNSRFSAEVILLLGNPANTPEIARAQAQKEFDTVSAWCGKHNVKVVAHENDLRATLEKIYPRVKLEARMVI